MKKFLVFLVGLAGLAMSLSGCVNLYRTTLVKDNYIHRYVEKNADVKPKKVGDSNVKFYVAKIEDNRKGHKFIYHKRTLVGIPTAKTKIDNVTLSLTNLTKKALTNAGWGVANNSTKANYLINIKVNSLGYYDCFLYFCIKNHITTFVTAKNNKTIIKKTINETNHSLISSFDPSAQYKSLAGKVCTIYYTALVNLFSSSDFKNTIMQDYFANLDNKTDNLSRQDSPALALRGSYANSRNASAV